MNKEFEIFEFKYIDKPSKEIKTIYARNEDIADLIIEVYNTCSTKLYDRKRFGFKKKIIVNIDPQVLEFQQMDTAEQELNSRIGNEKG